MKQFKKQISLFLLVIFLSEIITPNIAWALTGGPSQPEVQSFEPVSTTQMVDPFSGDFTYNIPLMDIDGYPINMSYHSGVTMDQEASWVGLGWNLNPGAINRNMRGIPDDFNGDQMLRKTYMKPSTNFGVNLNYTKELFGFTKTKERPNKTKDTTFMGKIGMQFGFGINYNNYKGLGTEVTVGAFFSGNKPLLGKNAKKLGLGVSGSLDLTFKSSSQEGLSMSASKSLGLYMDVKGEKFGTGSGIGINSSIQFNSISGTKKQMGFYAKPSLLVKSRGKDKVDENDDKNFGFSNTIGGSHVSYVGQSYSPKLTYKMSNYNLNLSYKGGRETQGLYSGAGINGFFSGQFMENRGIEESARAYGNYYAENADNTSLLDFNREKDGSFTIHNPNLPIPIITSDLYSYSGQGIGGMFKTYRSDLGQVYDKLQTNEGLGGKLGVELGLPAIAKLGADASFNWTWSYSKEWKNNLTGKFKYHGAVSGPLYEPAYFKSIGERTLVDEDYYPYTDLSNPESFVLLKSGKEVIVDTEILSKQFANNESVQPLLSKSNIRTRRDKRGVYIGPLTAGQGNYCLEHYLRSYPINHTGSTITKYRTDDYRKEHHFSQLSVVNPDGNKYIYGIPAYVNRQIEYSFTNAPNTNSNNTASLNVDCKSGHVEYDETKFGDKDRDLNGIDHYFDKSTTPAYAHSYLLTAILSPDYVDADADDGPSPGDYGTYTKINYHKVEYSASNYGNYRWRVPVLENKANYNRGLYNDDYDDNASIIYGEKEIWHVNTIEGRNSVAKFYISARKDALGVKGIHGGLDVDQPSYKLDSIKLFAKSDLSNPIKSVYFIYDYSLCKGVHNNIDYIENDTSANTGKLTLLSVYFTYGNSFKGKYNAYSFSYGYNPSYNLKAFDRWGNYKPNNIDNCLDASNSSTGEFPYVSQNKETADLYTAAWSINEIALPSGGIINIDYESDDYAYVQDKIAMQMYQVLGAGNTVSSNPESKLIKDKESNFKTNNNFLFVDLPDEGISNDRFHKMAMNGGEDLLYSFMVNLSNTAYDFANLKRANNASLGTSYEPIKGYAKMKNAGITYNSSLGRNIGWIEMEGVKVSDEVNAETNPITKASWQFTRINMPYLINPGASLLRRNGSAAENVFASVKSIVGFIPDIIGNFIDGNRKLRNSGYASEFNPAKSWIRLNNMYGKKLGGGSRVKRIALSDEWGNMDPSTTGASKLYGQIFTYTKIENFGGVEMEISSGVASYEPMIGNEENPFRKPHYYSNTNKGIPDDDYFTEEPFGESLFPSPQVGYSKVTIKSIQPAPETGLAVNKTGKVVHEYYTAKDFPTISIATSTKSIPIRPNWIWNLFYNKVEDYLTATQGYLIHLNDMHGKQKATYNFSTDKINEDNSAYAYSGVKYNYYTDTIKNCLNNRVKVITPQNLIKYGVVGVDAEVYSDSREEFFQSKGGGVNLNLDVISIGIIPIPIPTGIPEINNEITQFRSVVLMKVINSYGILKSTTAFENGASLTTENVLFDSETGEVLLTKTQNEFEDNIYNSKYPAHWVYEGMGGAYKNSLAKFEISPFLFESGNHSAFKLKIDGTLVEPQNYLVPGDIVSLGIGLKYWVYKTPSGLFVLLDRAGIVYEFSSSSALVSIQVIESGRKNMQTLPVAQYVSHSEPISGAGISHIGASEILQASVTEYKDNWPTISCGTYSETYLNFHDEAMGIIKYLFKTDQLGLENAVYHVSSPVNSQTCTGCTTATIDTFAYGDSTFLKAVYPKYIDSINLDKTVMKKQIYYTYFSDSNTWTLGLNFNLQPFILGSYKNLSFADDASFAWNCTIVKQLNDSNAVVNYLAKDVDHFTFTGAYNIASMNYGYLVFTDSDSILVQISLNSRITGNSFNRNVAKIANPFVMNVQNNWKPYKSWTYMENRYSQSDSFQTNIRVDGAFKSFTNFWTPSGQSWSTNGYPSKWQFLNEITKYHLTGAEAEERNPLNQFSSVLYSTKTHLPIAVGKNCKFRSLLVENFEELSGLDHITFCPDILPQYNSSYNLNNNEFAHSGASSFLGGRNFLVKFLHSDVATNNGTIQYILDTINQYGGFSPDSGTYVLSAWVKVDNGPTYSSYANAGIDIHIKKPGSITTIHSIPKGRIIDGWQRIEKEISFPAGTISAEIEFKSDTTVGPTHKTYFDDFRLHPKTSLVKGYVYNNQQKLVAELDENNYATFYEYDEEGNLIRVKKETERGIITLKEVRSSFKKNN